MPGRKSSTQQLLEQMSASVVPVEDPERAQARRGQVVKRLEALHDKIDERRQRAHRRTRRFAVLAAAAAPLLALGGYGLASHLGGHTAPATLAHAPAQVSVQSGSVLLSHGTASERPVEGSQQLHAGDRVRTGQQGRARVRMQSGTKVEMSPLTELTLGGETAGWRSERINLARGKVEGRVPQLPPGSSFAIVTPDANVEAHEGHFSVSYEPNAAGARTLVTVQEGAAVVRSHGQRTVLQKGRHWSSSATMDAQASAKTAAAAPASGGAAPAGAAKGQVPAAKRHAAVGVKTSGATKLPSATSASSLAEQNRLFQAAMDARRQGNDRRALSMLDQLLARYPGSPLEQDARVERFRALKRLGRGAAATRAARRYLAEHPDGFARDEARRMAIGPDGG